MDIKQYKKSQYKADLKETVALANKLRKEKKMDISLGKLVKQKYGVSYESYLSDLGIDPRVDTIQNLTQMDGDDLPWLVPEIIRSAVRLGLQKNAIWPNLIAADQNVNSTQVTFPAIREADATPKKMSVAEDFELGSVSFDEKSVRIFKIGRGIQIPYEVSSFLSLNVTSIFLQGFGQKMNVALDANLLDTLLNGDQEDGSDDAAVVGVAAAGNFAYRDLLRIWIRFSRIGKQPRVLIGNEDTALEVLDLPEFKTNTFGGVQPAGVATSNIIDLRTPIPRNAEYYIHGNIPTDQQLMVDPSNAAVKLTARPLMVEDERVVSKQVTATYVSLITGFANMFRDSRMVIDKSLAFSTNGFPAFLDVDSFENESFDKGVN